MNRRRFHTSVKTASVAGMAVLTLGLAACSTDEAEDTMSSASETVASAADSAMNSESSSSSESSTEAAPAEETPFGPGCQAYAEAHPHGPASLDALKDTNIADAVASIPELKTLATALTGGLNPEVNLADTLRGGEFTVFAPTEDAFAKLDAATIETLKQDPELLKSILTYHVVEGQASPSQAVGKHTTVNGAELEVMENGEDVMVNDATISCGGIQLDNATVYLIDSVLMPPEQG